MKAFPCSHLFSREVDRASHLRRLAQASWPCSAATDAPEPVLAAVRRLKSRLLSGLSAALLNERLVGLLGGGEGGIRTHGTVARTPHFECGAFDHSATSPSGSRSPGKAGCGRMRRTSSAPAH